MDTNEGAAFLLLSETKKPIFIELCTLTGNENQGGKNRKRITIC
jgi:hypothetical protein